MNQTNYTFAILGGDRRQTVIAQRLLDRGHRVRVYGLGELSADCGDAEVCTTAEKAITEADAVLLPLPTSRDGSNLSFGNIPTAPPLPLTDLVKLVSRKGCKLLLGGMIPEELQQIGERCGISVEDYYRSEALQRKNALPSAEGALMLAMEHTERTVDGMHALVCGYGRIGVLLTRLLERLGAQVTVAARRQDALCEIALSGYRALPISDEDALHHAAESSDVIFNTVPHRILTEPILKRLSRKPLYIEIASTPGGIDLPAARDMGMEIVFAPSLPGRYAPLSAGQYIFETVADILAGYGMSV